MASTAPQCPLNTLSKAGREYLRTLSKEDAYVWVQSKRRRVGQVLHGLDSIHNLVSPINRLPNELFLEIVRYAKPYGDSGSLSWLELAGVCREWREILLATPMLWTKINISLHPSFVQLCLKRSRNALITVHDGQRYSRYKEASVEALLPHLDRVLSFEAICLDSATMNSFISKLTVFMPHLERLSLALTGVRGPRAVFHSFNPFPRLCSLTFEDVEVPWSSSMLSGLSELDLSFDRPGLPALPLEKLLDILEASPHLTLLRMDGCEPTISAHTAPFTSPTRIVRLPELKTLKLVGKLASISCLLAHLDLPPDVFIELYSPYDCNLDEGFGLAEHPILGIFLRTPQNLADVTHASLALGDENDFSFEARVSNDSTQSMRLRIKMDYPDFGHKEEFFALVVCCSAVAVAATVHQNPRVTGIVEDRQWHDVLSRLTCVEELEIATYSDVRSFWRVFGSPRDNGDLYCPRLENLKFEDLELDNKTAGLVIKCLQDRMSHRHRLKTLEHCCHMELSKKLRRTSIEMLVDFFYDKTDLWAHRI